MDGVPYKIAEFLHVKPGKGSAFVRTKLKNFLNGMQLIHWEAHIRSSSHIAQDSQDIVTYHVMGDACSPNVLYACKLATCELVYI